MSKQHDNKNMTTEKKVIKLEVSDSSDTKYVDIELSYSFDTQDGVDNIISAINGFVNTHKEGLGRTNINILGYSYKY